METSREFASVDRETSHCKDVKPSSWRDLFIGEFNLQKVLKELEENNKRKEKDFGARSNKKKLRNYRGGS